MQTIAEFFSDLTQLGLHPVSPGLPQHDESSVPGLIASMRKTQKIERFRLPFSTSPAILGGVPVLSKN